MNIAPIGKNFYSTNLSFQKREHPIEDYIRTTPEVVKDARYALTMYYSLGYTDAALAEFAKNERKLSAVDFSAVKNDKYVIFIKELFDEAYDNFSKILKEKGVENLPKPKLKFTNKLSKGEKSDAFFEYNRTYNTLYADLKNIKKLENYYYIVEDGEISSFRGRDSSGAERGTTLLVKKQLGDALKIAPNGAAKKLGKDGVEILVRGFIEHEMSHYAQQIIMLNDPETSNTLFEDCAILKNPFLLKTAPDEFREAYPFFYYKGIGKEILSENEICGDKVTYSPKDFLNGVKSYEVGGGMESISNVLEIDANAKAMKYLEGQRESSKNEKLEAVIKEFKCNLESGYRYSTQNH